jgi:DNA-binding TFAR19-related protein (PDSD5 family)
LSEEDRELEKLKEKRLAEMQKNISYKQKQDEFSSSQKKKQENAPKPRDILVNQLGYRGLEVLENAERQFPNETKTVVEKLGELISLGEINEEIDGGKLLLLFRTVGLNIYLETKINVEQDGKFVSLSDKLSSKFSSSEESANQE